MSIDDNSDRDQQKFTEGAIVRAYRHRIRAIGIGLLVIGLLPSPVFAYVGPGAGISIVGSIVGVLAAIFLAIVGFVWYPIRRLLKRRKAKVSTHQTESPQEAEVVTKEESLGPDQAGK